MKILHLIPNGTYAYEYISKINSLFNSKNHLFYIYNDALPNQHIMNAENIIYSTKFPTKIKLYKFIIEQFSKADKIILHSLFMEDDLLRLVTILQIVFGKKYCWWIWGGDLYNRYWASQKLNKHSLKYYKVEYFRKILFRNMSIISAVNKEDYEFAVKWYQTKARYIYSFYPINLPEINNIKTEHNGINILIGNSATKQNRHVLALDKLKFLKDSNINIYCPVTYPCDAKAKKYIKVIEEYGTRLFPNRFNLITEHMEYDEYMKFLDTIDIAIFNNNRQQAGGNVAALLNLGKKVYINKKNTFYNYWSCKNVKVFSFDDINKNNFLTLLTNEEKNSNREIVREILSDKNFKICWNKIFNAKS